MALSGLAVFESLMKGALDLPADFLLLTVFACVAAPHTLNLGNNARISTLQPFILTAIVLFGVEQAMLLAAISMTYFWIVSRPRAVLYKSLFNLGNFVLSAWAAGNVYLIGGGRIGEVRSAESLLALLLSVLTFFVVNTGLTSIAIGLEQKVMPFQVWFEKYSWTINAQLVGGSLVIVFAMLRESLGTEVFFLTVPVCILIYHFYKVYSCRATREAHKT